MSSIFNNKYINLFNPDDGVEFIYSIIQSLGYGIKDFKSLEVRTETLEAIRQLLKIEMLEAYSWHGHDVKSEVPKLSNEEILKKVEEQWFIGADYVDFLSIVMFCHPIWYKEKLEELGFKPTTDWVWFIENKIGNIEKWIQDNKP